MGSGVEKTQGMLENFIKNVDKIAKYTGLFDTKIDISQLKVSTEYQNEIKNIMDAQLFLATNLLSVEKNVTDEIEDQVVARAKLEKEQKDTVGKLIIEAEKNKLKAIGASNSELLKRDAILKKQFKMEEDGITLLQKQLELQQAITEEKRLTNNVSSESLKIFEIAEEQGTKVAKIIGDVLSGDIDIGRFAKTGERELKNRKENEERGFKISSELSDTAKAFKIFKEQFSDLFAGIQAESFFKGKPVPGKPSLIGGAGISTVEQFGKRPTGVFDAAASLAKSKAEFELLRLQKPKEAKKNFVSSYIPPAPPIMPVPSIQQAMGLTRADLLAQQATDTAAVTNNSYLNFAEGSFVIHGSPDKSTIKEIEKAVRSATVGIKNQLVGKQTPTL